MASIAVRVRMPKRAVRQSECGSGCCDAVPIAGYDGVSAAAKPAGNILTVKVHVHNILHKTGQSNRQDLMRDFRMRS